MTLLGKILTVCIFMMSLVFMSFAVMVFSTHKNWKDVVMRAEGSAGQQKGLKFQLEEARAQNQALRAEKDRLELAAKRERAARAQALAALQTRANDIQALLDTTTADLRTKEAQLTVALQEMESTRTELVGLITEVGGLVNGQEVGGLREEIRTTQGQRDQYFTDVVALTDAVHQLQNIETTLTERRNTLLADISQYKLVLDRNGIDPSIVPTQPPALQGYITAISATNASLVEISLGKDDGLREGHYLEVSRNGNYVGRLAVVRVSSDKAVGQVLKELQRSPMQQGDLVRTKTN